MASDPDALRAVMGRFATGVTVVTTRVEGLDHAMTANAITSLSLEPLLILVCVEQEARFHDAILDASGWAVSILDEGGRAAAEWFATRGRPLHGQLDRVGHTRGPLTGAALLDVALATLECRTVTVYPGGDHSIVVGEVLEADVTRGQAKPLLWHRGRYTTLGESR